MTARYGERTYDASFSLERPAPRKRKSRSPQPASYRTPAFTIALITGIVSSTAFILVALSALLGG